MASNIVNNVLQQLRNILGGSFQFSAEKEGEICLLGEECAQMVDMARKKAVDDRVASLTLCQFAKLQFQKARDRAAQTTTHYPVR